MSIVKLFLILHLHQTTTSNVYLCIRYRCFLSCIYIKPQPCMTGDATALGCFLSCIYIKPQLQGKAEQTADGCFLSCIYIKPQHRNSLYYRRDCCFLSCIYIKPQPTACIFICSSCCFLSCIYIKPQPAASSDDMYLVVSYLASTSNHNCKPYFLGIEKLFLILHLHQTTTY